MIQIKNSKKSTSRRMNIIISAILIFCLIPSAWSQDSSKEDGQSDEIIIEEMVSKINTDIDPDYVYKYSQTKFVPPAGKTLLIMGQTVEAITEYLENFPDQNLPGGWAAYWGVTEFEGIKKPYKNNTGSTQDHQMLVEKFPNSVIQSAMWMVGKWAIAKKAGEGVYDKVIKKYAAWAKSANRPIYLRIGYEFDGPHNELEPRDYKNAYRHIVDLLRAENANNIAFVWHSYASPPFNDYKLSEWYPGDDYVDWVGISVFGHAYNADFGPSCDNVLEFAKQHRKPVMIAEANPVNGIDKEKSEVWDQWFVNFFNFIYRKNIKAVSFINEDWQSLSIPGISSWQDGRLFNNKEVSKAWFRETDKEHYLKQSPQLYKELDFTER